MNNNIYLSETIEECKKQIVDNSIRLDIAFAANSNLFECFIRTIRTIMLCSMLIVPLSIIIIKNDGKTAIFTCIVLACIYLLGCLLMSWVKCNYRYSYNKTKINLVDNLIMNCKEYNESEYEEWERKQIVKNMAALANLTVKWDNNDK